MIQHVLLAAALAGTSLSAAAADWYRVGETDDTRSYIDLASIVQDGQWTRAEEWAEYVPVASSTGVKRVRTILETDCAARQIRIAHFTAINEDGSIAVELDMPEQGRLHPAVSGSLFGDVADFVCGTDRSRAVRVSDPMTDPLPE